MEPIRVLQEDVILDPGGIEVLLMNLYRHIDREQLQFDFMVHRPTKGLYEDEITSMGGKIYHTPAFNPFKMKSYKDGIEKVLIDHPEYKVFHCHTELNLWPLKYATKLGVPVRVAHSHNAKSTVDLKYFFFLYEKMFIKKYCTDMFMCSKPAGEWSYGKKAVAEGRVKYLNGIVETNKFKYNEQVRREMREELNVGDKIVIGHIGRFMKQKNHMFLLEIFKEIHSMNPNTVLVLCGNGILEDNIKTKAKELGIENDVIYTGVKDYVNVETCRLYQAFDLFLFPSLWEGLPLSGIEAQTSGLPLVMSDVIAKQTIVTENVTQVSLSKSTEEWAKICLDILSKFERKDCQKQVVDAGFDVINTANFLQDFYIDRTLRARHMEKTK